MSLSRAEQINRDLRQQDWLIDQGVIKDMDDAAREARMATIRLNARVCPLCETEVDPTNWRRHFEIHHRIPILLLDESTPQSKAERDMGGRGAVLKSKGGDIGLLAFVDGRRAYVDTATGRHCYDAKTLTRLDEPNKDAPELPAKPKAPRAGRTRSGHIAVFPDGAQAEDYSSKPQPSETPNDEMQNPALVRMEGINKELAEMHRVDDVKAIRDKAEAMRVYARQAHLGLEAQNHAAEIKLRAERRAGELLSEMEKNSGTAGLGRPGLGSRTMQPPKKDEDSPTLADLGISKSQSSRWQAIAALPEPEFERTIAETKSADKELTTATALRQARAHKTQARRAQAAQTPAPQGRYRCIVIDPPWPTSKIERDVRPNQDALLDYPTMTLAEIAALPIDDLAHEDGCHLYLWTTQKYLPEALVMLAGWGFNYQCVLTWVKPGGMTPYSWMYNTELVLFGRRGDLPLLRNGLKLSFEAASEGHSIKPDVFFDERVIPASPEPRLEMFARRERDGFKVWGNEVNNE